MNRRHREIRQYKAAAGAECGSKYITASGRIFARYQKVCTGKRRNRNILRRRDIPRVGKAVRACRTFECSVTGAELSVLVLQQCGSKRPSSAKRFSRLKAGGNCSSGSQCRTAIRNGRDRQDFKGGLCVAGMTWQLDVCGSPE